jgi:hypothetical protein
VILSEPLAVLEQRRRRQPAVDHGRVLAADQRAERRPQRAFQIGRLEDYAAQRVPQLVDIHGKEHGAAGAMIEDRS